jgi:hypothetical protein
MKIMSVAQLKKYQKYKLRVITKKKKMVPIKGALIIPSGSRTSGKAYPHVLLSSGFVIIGAALLYGYYLREPCIWHLACREVRKL